MKKDTSQKLHRNAFAVEVERKVDEARDAFAISRDAVGLITAGRAAAQKTHDGGKLLAQATKKRDIAKAHFDIWMAKQRTKVRGILLAEREPALKTYILSPASKRGFKPTEPKQGEIDDYIKSTRIYRKWREDLADLEYALNLAKDAYFKPLDQRCTLIMSLGKIVYRESPE